MKHNINISEAFKELGDDEYFIPWIEQGFDRDSTRKTYSYGLKLFCDFTGMKPAQLIAEAIEDDTNRVPRSGIRNNKHMKDFLFAIKNKDEYGGYADYTKSNWVKAVKHFYAHFDVPLTLSKKARIPQTPTLRYHQIQTLKIEDVRKAIIDTGTNKLLKALILTAFSSGQGQAEIRGLKGFHLKNVIRRVAVVDVMPRQKVNMTNKPYFFFISPEALEAIKDYKPVIGDNDFVFTQKNSNKPLTIQQIDTMFARHAKNMGFDRSYFAPHRNRHHFKTTLTGNMDEVYIEFVMGHKVPYFEGKKTEMLDAYLKNIQLLTVFTPQEVLQKQYDELKVSSDANGVQELKNKILGLEFAVKNLLDAQKSPQQREYEADVEANEREQLMREEILSEQQTKP